MAVEVIGMSSLQRRLSAIGSPALAAGVMQRLALTTVVEAKLLVPRKTGNLGRSIHVVSVAPTVAIVAASAAYAGFVERGTRPHEIVPRVKKVLRFAAGSGGARLTGSPRSGAAVVFARRVHHPGTKPHPFMLPGAEKAVEKAGLLSAVVEKWNEAV